MQSFFPISFCCAGLVLLLCGILLIDDDDGARILLTVENGHLGVQGYFHNDRALSGTLEYTLRIIREGAAGRSSSSQNGSFETVPGQADTLSTTRINVQDGDSLYIALDILHNGDPVDNDQIETRFSDLDIE